MATKKKPYEKPKLKVFGSVKELTGNKSAGSKADAGAFPKNMMNCITPAPQIEEHRHLLGDQVSQLQFRKIIFATVKPGDVVLDLGTGSGIHAFFACQAGAAKVYAVDSDAIIAVAKDTAIANGFGEKIKFIQAEASELNLPEKVDVIITNIGFLNTIQTLPKVAQRHLKAGGQLIPSALELQFALVSAPTEYSERIQFWDSKKFGLDFSAFKRMASHHPLYTEFQTNQILSSSGSLGRLELLTLESDFVSQKIELTAHSSSIAHGLAGWYRFWANDQLIMSTEPPLQLDRDIWSEIFLPFERPLELKTGDTISFEIGMYGRGSDDGPTWRWRGWKNEALVVDQCSFNAMPVYPENLSRIFEQ